ncbi:MAG: tyrosine-type recombinase/integrase [Myxococcaceae bacterium]
MAAGGFRGTWRGGRIYWKDLKKAPADGRPRRNDDVTFYIWKSIAGRKYQVSTRCATEAAANKEFERFERDPEKYEPGGESETGRAAPIYLDAHPPENGADLDPSYLVDAYLLWCRDIRQNTKGWLIAQRGYLAWWADKLAGINLRTASLRDHIEPALGPENVQTSTRQKRIAVLKGLYSYMRQEKHARDNGFGIAVSEDPVFGTLRVPQSDPKKRKLKNKAVSKEHVMLAIEHLTGHWKSALILQAGTGWHVTEVQRFAVAGSIEPYPRHGPDKDIAGVLVCPEAKSGGELRTGVSREVLDAAKALRGRASFDSTKYGLAVRSACRAARIPVFTPGRMRHSFATHAVDSGADLQSLSTFLNHKSPATTRKFYATHGVAKRPPAML